MRRLKRTYSRVSEDNPNTRRVRPRINQDHDYESKRDENEENRSPVKENIPGESSELEKHESDDLSNFLSKIENDLDNINWNRIENLNSPKIETQSSLVKDARIKQSSVPSSVLPVNSVEIGSERPSSSRESSNISTYSFPSRNLPTSSALKIERVLAKPGTSAGSVSPRILSPIKIVKEANSVIRIDDEQPSTSRTDRSGPSFTVSKDVASYNLFKVKDEQPSTSRTDRSGPSITVSKDVASYNLLKVKDEPVDKSLIIYDDVEEIDDDNDDDDHHRNSNDSDDSDDKKSNIASDEEDEYDDENENPFGDASDLLSAFKDTRTARGLHSLQDALLNCPDEGEFADDPPYLTVKLMLHQKRALKFLMNREEKYTGGILADDMGLGKTITMIALILSSLPAEISRRQNDFYDSDDDWDTPIDYGSGRKGYGKNTLHGGTLVVCPTSLLDQWKNEIINRTKRGLLRVKVHHGTYRSKKAEDLCNQDIIITTYNLLHLDMRIWSKIHWRRVILDEAHTIRNPATRSALAACQIKADKRWAMTGTPVHNKPLDIYSLIKFLGCAPWDDRAIWNRTMRGTKNGMACLTTVLKSLIMRRTKEELQANGEMPPLPEKNLVTIKVQLNEDETKVYKTLLAYSQTLLTNFLIQQSQRSGRHDFLLDMRAHGRNSRRRLAQGDLPKEIFDELNKALMCDKGNIQQYHILVLLLRLRQICDHPALTNKMIEDSEIINQGVDDEGKKSNRLFKKVLSPTKTKIAATDDPENPMRADNPVFQDQYESSKVKIILETVSRILPSGDKIIIVSQWTSALEIIEFHLAESGETRYEKFTGEVRIQDRQDIVDRFNKPGSDTKILLLSLTAGGQGINLFGANHLILMENHWNPQLEKQAEDRIYRFGQKKDVFIYRFLCSDTIEERVKELQDTKLELAANIFMNVRLTSTRLTISDLKHLFNMR